MALAHPSAAQVLDGVSRLFTMPFAGDLTMWQLSFPLPEASALADLRGDGAALADLARDRVGAWDPGLASIVRALVDGTAEDDLWSAPLYDRDAMDVDAKCRSRATVLGDACHPMTCFKGAGANNALADAPLLARCLTAKGTNVPSKLRTFEREMVARAAPRAAASRRAATILHSPAALETDLPTFALVPGDATETATRLKAAGLSATSHDDLEAAARATLYAPGDACGGGGGS